MGAQIANCGRCNRLVDVGDDVAGVTCPRCVQGYMVAPPDEMRKNPLIGKLNDPKKNKRFAS